MANTINQPVDGWGWRFFKRNLGDLSGGHDFIQGASNKERRLVWHRGSSGIAAAEASRCHRHVADDAVIGSRHEGSATTS